MLRTKVVSSERFKERLEASGLSQSELARRIGVSQNTIWKLAQGGSTGSKHLHKMAEVLGTTPYYLTGETDDPKVGALLTPTPEVLAEQLDLVLVPQIDMSYGLGATFVDERPVKSNPVPFPRKWLQLFSASEPESMFFAQAEGDSMEPTIMDSDIVLVDRSQSVIRGQDRMWAIAMGPLGMIKRVRALPDGTFKIISDNPRVPPEIACESELHVVGRVVGVVRKT